MRHCLRKLWALPVLTGAIAFAGASIADDDPVFTDAFLQNTDHIEEGRDLFRAHCISCHGKSSYPGKAPKLKPEKLSAEDVYLRITYGWKKMPPWEDVYSQQQRMVMTAYIKSPIFSN